jgi:oligopeptidase A
MDGSRNPLLESRGLPSFAAIRPEDVAPAIESTLTGNRGALDAVLERGEHGWQGLAEPLFDCEERLHRAWGPVRHLHGVRDEPSLRDAFNIALPRVTEYSTEILQNRGLFEALRDLAGRPELDAAQRRWADQKLIDFRLGGAELESEAKARFAEICLELSKLSSKFGENLLDETNDYAMVLTDPAELAGLPETVVAAAAEAAGRAGAWKFSLQLPSYQPFMTFAESRARRAELYRAYFTRATAGGRDNGGIIDRILELRCEAAALLGYAHWTERTLVRRMARSSEEVESFLLDLARRARPRAERELDSLHELARTEGGPETLESWDLPFWSERLRQREFGFSEEELRGYFPEPAVVEGLFGVARRLYGLEIREREGVETWDPHVRFFDVHDEAGVLRGSLYLDLYAREGKRGGAWMDEAVLPRRGATGLEPPVAYLVCNFAPPTADVPSLLTHRDVATLFHEFGHALHHVLTAVDVPGLAGLRGVAWDAIEFPSQFHENWAWQPECLRLFARHYRTGEAIPAPLLERLLASRRFQAGLQMLRQLEFALSDLRLHTTFVPGGSRSVQDCFDGVREEIAVVRPPAWSRFQNGFGHVFGGGYAAGYYSYKWAEVLAADAFSSFEERGIFDPTTGRAFMRCILERGGSDEPARLFEEFRGRPPRIDALLRQCGIAA